MKTLTLLVTLMAGAFAQATETVNFTYFGNEGRNRIHLSCHYAENAVDQILGQIGATDVDVRCTGGIDYGFYTPVSITAKFNLPTTATVKVESDFNTNCFFDTKFVDALVRSNDNITKVNGRSHCFDSDSRYNYTLEIK